MQLSSAPAIWLTGDTVPVTVHVRAISRLAAIQGGSARLPRRSAVAERTARTRHSGHGVTRCLNLLGLAAIASLPHSGGPEHRRNRLAANGASRGYAIVGAVLSDAGHLLPKHGVFQRGPSLRSASRSELRGVKITKPDFDPGVGLRP